MGISGGGIKRRRRSGLHGTPDTGTMFGMPMRYAPGTIEANVDSYDSRGRKVLAGTSDMNSLAGMPNTRRLNGGWGVNHPGRMENRRGGAFTTGELNAAMTRARWTSKEERRAERGLKKLLKDKERKRLKDPHEDDDLGKVRLNGDDKIGFLSEKVKNDGSVVAGKDGLCLKGEEGSDCGGGKRFYSADGGKRKWRTLDEIDQNVGSVIVGADVNDQSDKPNAGSRDASNGKGWKSAVLARIAVKDETKDGVSLKKVLCFGKNLLVSDAQRLVGASGEDVLELLSLPEVEEKDMTFITGISYDTSSHSLVATFTTKKILALVSGGGNTDTTWNQTVFQATSHQEEHEESE